MESRLNTNTKYKYKAKVPCTVTLNRQRDGLASLWIAGGERDSRNTCTTLGSEMENGRRRTVNPSTRRNTDKHWTVLPCAMCPVGSWGPMLWVGAREARRGESRQGPRDLPGGCALLRLFRPFCRRLFRSHGIESARTIKRTTRSMRHNTNTPFLPSKAARIALYGAPLAFRPPRGWTAIRTLESAKNKLKKPLTCPGSTSGWMPAAASFN